MTSFHIKSLAFLVFILMAVVACEPESPIRSRQSESIHAEKLNCPENAQVEYAPWGETGWVKACKQNHGKYVVWEGEMKKIDGEFFDGEKTGIWTYFKDDGSVEKTVDYGKP